MRVLHLDSQRGWRGGEHQAELLVRGLAAQATTVAVVGRAGAPWLQRCRAMGIVGFENNLRVGPLSVWGLRRIFRQFAPDVVHCHDAGSILPAALAAALQIIARRPAIVAARRVDFPIRSQFKYRRLCDRVISVSRAVTDVLIAQGLPPAHIRTVLDGIDPARFGNMPSQITARQAVGLGNLPPQAIVGLCIAALTDHKDHATLLKAWRTVVDAHSDAYLLLAGQGELQETLQDHCRALNMDRKVRFLGWRDDIPQLFAAADIFLLTSHHEGLGSTLMDAQFCGLPVVATRAGGIPEIVTHERTGMLVPPQCPDLVAQAVLRLIADPDLRHALGRAGKSRASTAFVADRMVQETLNAYSELLAVAPVTYVLQAKVPGSAGDLCAIPVASIDPLPK